MKLETVETRIDTFRDAEAITKRWYTEQRGRRLGNTVAWGDLTRNQQIHLIREVTSVLGNFYIDMCPEPTPVEKRQCATN